MIFYDEEHREFYFKQLQKCKNDTYTRSLIYTLGICENTRSHFDVLYNQKLREIIPEQLHSGWQTETSYKATRLAFNLFTDSVPTAYIGSDDEEKEDFKECREYSVSDIFCCELAPFFVQAIKIRYPEYFSNKGIEG